MPKKEQRQLPHVYLPGHGHREDFTSPHQGGSSGAVPKRDRIQHARRLEKMLTEAIETAQDKIANRDPEISGGTPGFYLEFEVPETQQDVLDKLEYQGRNRVELVAARPSPDNPALLRATVFVPESRYEYHLSKIRAYAETDSIKYEKDEDGNRREVSRRPKNEDLVASLEAARIAKVEDIYTDDPKRFPGAREKAWWEVWLRDNRRSVFEHAAGRLRVAVKEHEVKFAEREVILAHTTPETIGHIIENTDAVAEVRLARDTPAFFMGMDGAEQAVWSQELAARLVKPGDNAPSVCLLDSGTTRRHRLIAPALAERDQQAWRNDWHGEDTGFQWGGHGTQMSGVALYGDLTEVLAEDHSIELFHRLESVKILPDHGESEPGLYGHITATAVGRVEVQAPGRRRAYCLAVTSDGDYWRGRPSSWSAKIDDLVYGDGENQRLIIVSAGNIGTYYPEAEYLNRNDTTGIESPAQAWNVLTVGAITERCTITHPDFSGWEAMAPPGDLSPCSRTSVSWHDDWPIKPDVVFEGGNYGVDPVTGIGDHLDDLALLTTFNRPEEREFTVTSDTSAATAQVTRMAAQILADQPELWPETVRALIVHSAEWTSAMLAHLPPNPNQRDRRLVLRRYGYGVPSLARALRSFSNDVTLVIESDLQPYISDGSKARNCDMMLHELPWPIEALKALGSTQVEMRVTLSYFVEPNPGERGWTQRHRYGGYGLRFAVKRPEESLNRFRQRINAATREGNYEASGGSDGGWVLGPRLRDRGALHSDAWRGTATDLANRQSIGVFPVSGWWREKPKLRRVDRHIRYTLVISLRADVDVDLYTEIANVIGVGIDVDT